MRKTIKIAIALLCVLAMMVPAYVFAADLTPPTSPPGGNTDTEITTNTTYEYISFGSYPQTEVVSQASDSGESGKAWETASDYIIDASLYSTLQDLSEDQWDAKGDATVGGSKYRRIKSSDATYTYSASDATAKSNSAAKNENEYYNWASADTYHYFKYEPIVWRVLQKDGNDAFLLSEKVLDTQMYNTNITGTLHWENCTLRSWLNGYDGSANECSISYTDNNFINTAFTAEEQAKIKTTALENNDNIEKGTEGGNNTEDKIYLLSEDEVYGSNATAYGFVSDHDSHNIERQAQGSAYAKTMGLSSDCDSSSLGNCFWWLRSPGSEPGLFALVRSNGSVYRGGQHANSKTQGVRPAMHISLQNDNDSEKEYTVSYDANGGSGAPEAQTKTHGTALTLSSTIPTYEGHTFLGWAESSGAAEAAYQAGGTYEAEAAITLYAVWKDHTPGDVNGDGEVTIMDVLRLLKHVAGQTVDMAYDGDVNNDGNVTIMDVLRLLKYVAGQNVEIY